MIKSVRYTTKASLLRGNNIAQANRTEKRFYHKNDNAVGDRFEKTIKRLLTVGIFGNNQ